MLSGSDEFVLREILNDVDHIADLYYMLNRNFLELEYANDLKEFELGIIDQNELVQRRNRHYAAVEQMTSRNK